MGMDQYFYLMKKKDLNKLNVVNRRVENLAEENSYWDLIGEIPMEEIGYLRKAHSAHDAIVRSYRSKKPRGMMRSGYYYPLTIEELKKCFNNFDRREPRRIQQLLRNPIYYPYP